MHWRRTSRLRRYLNDSFWAIPAIAMLVGGLLAFIDLSFVENHISLPQPWRYSADAADTVLAAVVSAMVGLTGIVVAVAVLIIQLATGTLSPRYMRIWYRDPQQKAVFAGFLGTLAFAYFLLRNIRGDHVPDLGVSLAGIAVLVSMLVFLRYIDRFAHLLRPVALAAYLADVGAKVTAMYWQRLEKEGLSPLPVEAEWAADADEADLTVRADRGGVVQAIDPPGMLELAGRHDAILVLRCAIGDYLPAGDVLLDVYGRGELPTEDTVRRLFLIGTERDYQEDPAFALRIIVDIAIRALSPAVNDPTTGVQCLDYIEGLLLQIGERELPQRYEVRDPEGTGRVVVTSRTWDDYLTLGVVEILEYGSTSTQVTRRLRAMLGDLLRSVHTANRPAVRAQIDRLDAALAEDVPEGARREFASRADRQGLGGSARSNGHGPAVASVPRPWGGTHQ